MEKFIGLDSGSVSVKVVLMNVSGKVLHACYERHHGHPVSIAHKLLKKCVSIATEDGKAPVDNPDFSLSITGSSGKFIADILGIQHVNEVVSQSMSVQKFFPSVKTIIEMGGEDSKLIILNESGIEDFSMNSVCAAGTGSFLEQQAERLKMTIEEFSEIALKSRKPPRIAGRCSVFAKSDMIHLQQIASPIEDIVAGLCFAVARNFKGSIVKGRTINPEISFQGGVAANAGMRRAFKEIFNLHDLVIPEHFAYMGAIGAVLKDMHGNVINNRFNVEHLKKYDRPSRSSDNGRFPLVTEGDDFFIRHGNGDENRSAVIHSRQSQSHWYTSKIKTYLGIDIGSISTNLAVIDGDGKLLAKRYLMTSGRPIEAVRQGLEEIGSEIGEKIDIVGVGTTGSGRYMIADFVGADIVKNEITAQARAAAEIDPSVDTIFEIGGQDSKFISLHDGVIIDFEMNKACAAGTGSFLEEQAEKLNIPIKEEFANCAFSSKHPCNLGERCTVFMENSLMANLQQGVQKDDLLAGLAYSIVENYINRVVSSKKIGKNIFFQGGTAFNKSVVAAFEKFTGQKITVPPNHDVTGAIGMALIARDELNMKGNKRKTSFKGFGLSRCSYSISSFECKGCSNVCEINKVKIENEKNYLHYGGRCEKYDIKKKKRHDIEDLFLFRENLVWQQYKEKYELKRETPGPEIGTPGNVKSYRKRSKPAIGIPYIFFFQDFLPFWTTLLYELGIEIVVSPRTNRQIVNMGCETILSETCFPVKVAHGHIKYLLDNNINNILLPSFVKLSKHVEEFDKGAPCPYTQTIPYLAHAAFNNINIISPIIDFSREEKFIVKEIRNSLKSFGISLSRLKKAYKTASEAQDKFIKQIEEKGRDFLSSIHDKTIVIVGRAYNSYDSGVNLQIPQKLATLNIRSVPMDFLPLDEVRIKETWPNMYWKNGEKILKAARFIKKHPLLYPIYIGNFNCGPDSFIYEYFKEEMGEKPFLYLEIDEHSADAGAITRCEAFLDSIENREISPVTSHVRCGKSRGRLSPQKKIFIPRMSDHAFGLSAAFEYSGISAEVLPESTSDTVELGRKHVSGKQCFPCVVTNGEMLKKLLSPDFDSRNSAFFMPSGTGPCRFGQYNIFQRLVLERLGYGDIMVFSPVQDTRFYDDLGIAGEDFVRRSWEGIIAIEMLTKCLHETRPYEREKGKTDSIYNFYLEKMTDALKKKDHDLEALLREIRKEFESIHRHNERKPLIGIVGEIYVRSNKFTNEDLINKIETLGGEVWLSPPEEWLYYVNYIGLRHALMKRNMSAAMKLFIKNYYQTKMEHKFQKIFKGFLKTIHEPSTRVILKKARTYVHDSFEGETILSVGKSISKIEHGVDGLVSAMPFGCMPGTIVTAILKKISSDYNIPALSIPYDGTQSVTTEIQLEAFMHQANEYRKAKQYKVEKS
jgi:predicted CoA-substrate-specific enzyme activase